MDIAEGTEIVDQTTGTVDTVVKIYTCTKRHCKLYDLESGTTVTRSVLFRKYKVKEDAN